MGVTKPISSVPFIISSFYQNNQNTGYPVCYSYILWSLSNLMWFNISKWYLCISRHVPDRWVNIHVQCGVDIMQSVFSKVFSKDTHSLPVRATYGVSFMYWNSDVYSTSTPAMMYTVPVHVWPCNKASNCMWPTPALQWCHNGHNSVSNHQPHECLLNRLFRRRSKKTSKLRVTGLCVGNSPGTGEFPAQMTSYAENVSIWWRHHVAIAVPLMPQSNEAWGHFY